MNIETINNPVTEQEYAWPVLAVMSSERAGPAGVLCLVAKRSTADGYVCINLVNGSTWTSEGTVFPVNLRPLTVTKEVRLRNSFKP